MQTPEELLKTWIRYVNDGELEKLLALYREDAVLIPTFSNRILDKPEKLHEYFQKLLSREELSVVVHEKTVSTHKITDTVYTLSGIYCWRLAVDDEMLSFEARFSFLFDLSLPAPIIQHHSSQIPRML
jgi:hypothetical protein